MSKLLSRFLFIYCLIASVSLSAQQDINPTSNAPYSRLGIGDLLDQNFAATAGMGGLSATYHDPYHINILNPASYAWLRATAFEVGINSEYTRLNDGDNGTNIWDGQLNYMAIGFPMRNPINEALDRRKRDFGWGMGLALTPYSRVNYDIITTSALVDSTNTVSSFKGNGGTYKLHWGTGIRYKNLAVGATLGYFFGKNNYQRQTDLQGAGTHYRNDLVDATSVSGVTWNAGIMYDLVFKSRNDEGKLVPNGKKLVFGAYGNSTQDFTANTTNLYQRIYTVNIGSVSGAEIVETPDTMATQETLPSELSFGIQYVDENKLRVGFNYTLANWSEFSYPIQTQALSNAYKASFGVEFTPDDASYNKYLNRVRYRIGGFYHQDPRSFGGEQLQHYAITLGMGMPVVLPRQQTSFVNIALEAGQFGLPDALRENYVKLTLGFTLNDNSWFYKRKFN